MATRVNALAVIGGNTPESATEASVLPDGTAVLGVSMASGHLTITDSDPGQAAFEKPKPSSMHGAYGQFSFDVSAGDWTYALNQAKANALAAGVSKEDKLIITSLDGQTSETITVTVHGTNDAPTLTAGKASARLMEAGYAGSGICR